MANDNWEMMNGKSALSDRQECLPYSITVVPDVSTPTLRGREREAKRRQPWRLAGHRL
jgi:hypothetical protein